jgi:hypothetical protein
MLRRLSWDSTGTHWSWGGSPSRETPLSVITTTPKLHVHVPETSAPSMVEKRQRRAVKTRASLSHCSHGGWQGPQPQKNSSSVVSDKLRGVSVLVPCCSLRASRDSDSDSSSSSLLLAVVTLLKPSRGSADSDIIVDHLAYRLST